MSDQSAYDPEAFRAFVLEGWQRAAPAYHDRFGQATAQTALPMLDAVGAGFGTRLLDLACGPGVVSAAALMRGATVTGLDLSTAMVAEAARRYPGAEFREGDAEKLPFPGAHFEAVVCNFGMTHFPRPERALLETHRVLAPGGRFAFTRWKEGGADRQILAEAIEKHGDPDAASPKGPPQPFFAEESACERFLSEAGFTDFRTETVAAVMRVESAEELMEVFETSTVRTASLLKAQSEEARARIRRAIAQSAKEFEQGGVLDLPMPAILMSAMKR